MQLPTTKSAPKVSLGAMNLLIYGDPKVGKSTFASQIPNAIFFATEQGHNFLEVFKVDIKSWDDMLAACQELQKGKHAFKTVIFDTVDILYSLCERFICKRENVSNVADLEFGKGFSMVRAEFMRVVNNLNMLGFGLVFISHAKEKELKTKTQSYTVKVCSLSDKPATMVTGMCDFILYCYIDEKGERIMRTKPTKYVIHAGDRSGRLPDVLAFGYQNFMSEFNKAVGIKEEKTK